MKVIKIGGNAIAQLNQGFYDTLKTWTSNGERVLIVHGGGPLITQVTEFFGLKSQKIDGVRVTDKTTLLLTRATLTKVIQPYFSSLLRKAGLTVNALNQDGQVPLTAEYLDQNTYGLVGHVVGWKQSVFEKIQPGEVALLTSLGYTDTGHILNINADNVAENAAVFVHSDELILLTDVPGILAKGQVLENISTAAVKKLISDGVIKGGMVAKVEAAIQALTTGVSAVRITNQLEHPGTLITIKGVSK